ncbi:hypothetical protein DFH06DRAFT_142686 [Mycena polygramma]|nr:hypothetical protein DFH06DRAFT_142686 [Mycena polygramma]
MKNALCTRGMSRPLVFLLTKSAGTTLQSVLHVIFFFLRPGKGMFVLLSSFFRDFFCFLVPCIILCVGAVRHLRTCHTLFLSSSFWKANLPSPFRSSRWFPSSTHILPTFIRVPSSYFSPFPSLPFPPFLRLHCKLHTLPCVPWSLFSSSSHRTRFAVHSFRAEKVAPGRAWFRVAQYEVRPFDPGGVLHRTLPFARPAPSA